ncbi:MAG: D-glycerate dehydrogenase [Cohaesibacter sp.]|jgi:lactate dehydrogenase-like 2-hydroxyacid dehydrogenase|nr:D-glycerate dehydrogenase [Cohaesibacter sp.]
MTSETKAARPRLIVTRKLPKQVEDYLAGRFDAVFNEKDEAFTPKQLKDALSDADALLPTAVDGLSKDMMEGQDLRCKIIANFGVGYNNIDVDAASGAGIAVTNTPGVLTDCTADIAVALLLMSARRTTQSEKILRAAQWEGFSPTFNLGAKVTGKTLGIIGMGRIGKAMAKRCHFGFDMPVVFYNRSKMDPDEAKKFGATQLDSVEDVLKTADFVSLHCPGGGSNRHLINAQRLSMMKPSAHLINTARGEVVDETALIAALQTGTIAGAGLDVFEEEPSVPKALTQLETVSLLPHIGSGTLETRTEMGMMAANNLVAFFEGKKPDNQVN